MAKLIDIGSNAFLNADMIVFIGPQGTQCVVTLITGKAVTLPMDSQTFAKKCMAS
jgi:hypothetical protein